MKRRKVISILVAVAAFAVLAGTVAPAADFTYSGPPIKIRFSAYYPPAYPVYQVGISKWIPEVEKGSGGRIKFEIFLSGVLHQAKDGFKAMTSDIADLTTGYPAYQPGAFHLAHVADLPFAFPNSYTASLVLEELYPKYLKKEYESLGVYLGFYTSTSAYNLITKKPVHKLEDLKGMKIRSFGGACSDMLKKLGAVPVTVQSSEVYTSFERGIMDGTLFSDNSSESYKLQEIGKYLIPFGITQMGIPYCLNKKTFDAMPPDVKKYFYDELRVGGQIASNSYEVADKEAREKMVKAGLEVINLDPAEMKRMRDAVEPLWNEFIEKNEKDGYPAKQFVTDLRALVEKYKGLTAEQALEQVKKNPVKGIITF